MYQSSLQYCHDLEMEVIGKILCINFVFESIYDVIFRRFQNIQIYIAAHDHPKAQDDFQSK